MPCWGQPTGAETAPFLPRNASPILSPSTAFWEENQPITLFQDLPHLLSLSIPLSLTSSGNLSQKALSFTQFRACSMLLRGTKLQPVLHPFLPPPTIEPFPTLIELTSWGIKTAIYNYWICLRSLSHSLAPCDLLQFSFLFWNWSSKSHQSSSNWEI